jgi:two-component system cell cycle response regulator DivK
VSSYGDRPPRILLVEDDDAARIGYAELLQVQGFTVDAVATGADALAVATRVGPDIIITDVRLPDTDGLSLAEQLRQQPAMAEVPIIAVTAYWSPESRARARAAGVSAFLLKPSAPAHVLAEIQRVLSHGADASV